MGNKTNNKPVFRVIPGGLLSTISFNSLKIAAAPEKSQPFPVKAIAHEEDTWLVMSAKPDIHFSDEHPIRFMTDLIEARPEPVGSVLLMEGDPAKMLAVVHDVNRDPTWREEWIEAALKEVFRLVEEKGIDSIGMHLLGTKHGNLEEKRFSVLLGNILRQVSFTHLKKLWLIAPAVTNQEVIAALKAELDNK
jgi:hypothetical protein